MGSYSTVKSLFSQTLSIFFICLLVCFLANGAEVHVDQRNQSSVADGTAAHPFRDIQTALDHVQSGDSILIAQGTYTEALTIDDKKIILRGGYGGGTAADYNSGNGGDFLESDPEKYITQVKGNPEEPTLLLQGYETSGSEINGLTVSGGSVGIHFDVSATWPWLDKIVLSNLVIESNGTKDEYTRGGGLFITGKNHLIRQCMIRNNEAGLGAGIYLNAEEVTIEDNHIIDNRGHGDHGAGIYQVGDAIITNNTISGNRVGVTAGYGWGGGVLILGEATMRHNRIHGNESPSGGGGVFADEGAELTMEHELIYGNISQGNDRGAAAVYVDGGPGGSSHVQMTNCTIVYNQGNAELGGNGVYVEQESSATLKNCILWGNGGDDFYHDDTSSITATYTLSEENMVDEGNFSADPLFADADNDDFHLRSRAGRFKPDGEGGGQWVMDEEHSPAIDAGDPSSPYTVEPEPNGGRINLGAYGNTVEASKSIIESEGEPPAEPHPADGNGNGRITIQEAQELINDWQEGTISMRIAIHGFFLAQKGGRYYYDETLPEPECWISADTD